MGSSRVADSADIFEGNFFAGFAFLRVNPMCRSLFNLFIAFVFLLLCGPIRAQDAGKIVDQYVKAAGGSKTLSRVQTLTIEGTFTNASDGKPGTYTLSTKLPNRYYSELVIGDKNLIEAYNGKSAWHQNAAGEIGTLVGAEGFQLEAAGQYYNCLLYTSPSPRDLSTSRMPSSA